MYIGNNASPILKINLIIQDNNQECSLNIVQVQVEYILDTYIGEFVVEGFFLLQSCHFFCNFDS